MSKIADVENWECLRFKMSKIANVKCWGCERLENTKIIRDIKDWGRKYWGCVKMIMSKIDDIKKTFQKLRLSKIYINAC